MATTHLMLISDQAAANLLPALDPALKPARALLLTTARMEAKARTLQTVLKQAGIEAHVHMLQHEQDLEGLKAQLLDVVAGGEGEIWMNLTGGTKLMALAAFDVASAAELRAFYVDIDTDKVTFFGKQIQSHPLSSAVRLSHYLRAYGHTLLPHKPSDCRQHHLPLIETLVKEVTHWQRALGQLNVLAQKAEETGALRVRLNDDQRDSRSLEALLDECERANVLTRKDDAVVFSSDYDRRFAGGIWLEEHVSRTIGTMKPELGITDSLANAEVQSEEGVKNEMDFAFLARNRLFLIECKTARMNFDDAAGKDKANDVLYRLSERMRHLGGQGTRGMLVSYRELGEAEKKRARELHIEVVSGQGLWNLSERLRKWVGGRRSDAA